MKKQKLENNFQIYNKQQYYEHLLSLISVTKAGDRISMMTMAFDSDDEKVQQVMEGLCHASKRGVNVLLCVDAMAFLLKDEVLPGPLFYFNKIRFLNFFPTFKRRHEALTKLKESGGRYVITNKPKRPFSLPVKGRSHIKFTAINSQLFIGGCNLNDSKQIDVMVGLEHVVISKKLHKLSDDLLQNPNVASVLGGKDQKYKIDKHADLLIDCGLPKSSLIYEEAIKIIDDAKGYLYFTCQYFPNGLTSEKLFEAHKRGINVKIYYNSPFVRGFPSNLLHYFVKKGQSAKRPKEFFENELKLEHKLHSKILFNENKAIVGSHNMIEAGVRFGTAEIALVFNNTECINDDVFKFFSSLRNYLSKAPVQNSTPRLQVQSKN